MRLLKAYTAAALVSHQTSGESSEGIKRWVRHKPEKTCIEKQAGRAPKNCGEGGYCCNADTDSCTDLMKAALPRKDNYQWQCVLPIVNRTQKEKNQIKKCLDGYKPEIYNPKHGNLAALLKNLADVVAKFIDRPNYQCHELKRIRKTFFNLVQMKNKCAKRDNKIKQKDAKKAKKAAEKASKSRRRRNEVEYEEELDETVGVVNSEEKNNLDKEVALLENGDTDDLAAIFKQQCTDSNNINTEDQEECDEIEELIRGLADDGGNQEEEADRRWIVARIIRVRNGIQTWTNAYITPECSKRQNQLNDRIKRMGKKIKNNRTQWPTSPKKQMAKEKKARKEVKEKKEKALTRANRKNNKEERARNAKIRLEVNRKKQEERKILKAQRETKKIQKQS